MSGRAYPANVESQVITPRVGTSYYAAIITLPLRAGETELDRVRLYVSTAEMSLNIGGVATSFSSIIRGEPSIKFSEGKAPDGGELVLDNLELALGRALASSNYQKRTSVVVLKCWLVYGAFVFDEVFNGFVKTASVDGESVRMSLISDMNRKGQTVGGLPVTLRCTHTFKDGIHCTAVSAATFCSHVLDDAVQGCLAYDRQYEFSGVPVLAPRAAAINDDPFSNGNGWSPDGFPHPTSPRFDPDYHPYIERFVP